MITKEKAGYVDDYNGNRKCKFCNMFKPPNECTLVKGDIQREGHCRKWEVKKEG